MEQLAILERIYGSIYDTLDSDTDIYVFSAAIYDNWSANNSSDLERNLAKRLVNKWKTELEVLMWESYKETKYDEKRIENNEYYKKWIERRYKSYSNHNGIQRALMDIWEKNYGARVWT